MEAIKRIIFLIIFLIIVGCTIFYFHYGTPWNMSKHKMLFVTYLEDAYQKDFIISEISYDIFHNVYHANAYEKGNPDLIFYVGEDNSNKEISDGYKFEVTLFEAKKDIEKIVKEDLPGYEKFNVELISDYNKELEIGIWTNQDVNDNTKHLIQSKIEEKGYIAKQLYFYME